MQRALVVEDELATRLVVAGILRAHGLDVTVAADGEEAWELHRKSPFPLVVTDWMMPRTTGVELARKIRSVPSDSYTYVLVVTSLSAREHTLQAFEAGADDMLSKPVDAEQIGARLGVARRFLEAHARKAEEAYRSSLEAMQSELGHEHAALGQNLSALVRLYRGQGALARARAFLRREIDVTLAAHGPDHPRLGELRAQLAAMKDPTPVAEPTSADAAASLTSAR